MKNFKSLITLSTVLFLSASCVTNPESKSHSLSENGQNVRISWDYNTYQEMKLVEVENKGYLEKNLYYPRIKKLSNGRLLMSFMNDHFGWDAFVRHSDDEGKTWSDARMIRQRFDAQSSVGDDQIVFVNPDFIELHDGRILLAYQWRYRKGYNDLENTNENCGIEIMFSDDGGKTFSQPRRIYLGRCWEPAMLQLPSGEIQMYITDSNEVVNSLSQPCTMLIRSFDGGETWQGKDYCTYRDGEIISRTFDERGSYGGMPSGVLLDDNYGIAVPVEIWSSRFKVDQTPVIVRTDMDVNWYSDQSIRKEGGPGYPYKKQLNKDFTGFGPYSAKLPSGEMVVLSNGVYKNQQAIWVFIGNRKADNFRFPTSPFEGYWGSIDYIGDGKVIAAATYEYKEADESRACVKALIGRLNYAKEISKGDIEMAPVAQFNREKNDYWFLGKETPGSVLTDFGYTDEYFIVATYLFDKNLIAYTPENSDASTVLLNRKTAKGDCDSYKIVVNANGEYVVYKEETSSWKLIEKGKNNDVEVIGTINNTNDEDMGFGAKLKIDWNLLGGKPQNKEVFRAHLRHHYKKDMKEGPIFATIEDLAGENSDYPQDWLEITFK